jgi:hypothetical protein
MFEPADEDASSGCPGMGLWWDYGAGWWTEPLKLVLSAGLEPATYGFRVRCIYQLSYESVGSSIAVRLRRSR